MTADKKQAPKEIHEKKEIKKEPLPALKPGMVIKVYQKVKDIDSKGEQKERVQMFEGTIIAAHKMQTPGATIRVRKISFGVGVEKVFPLTSPTIAQIKVVKQLKTKSAKLYFLRNYSKKMDEVKIK